MNYWVHTAQRYRASSILGRVHAAFFNHYQFHTMTYIPDETVLARMMTTLHLEFEKAMHYHSDGCESDNNWHLTFSETPPSMPEVDSDDDKYLPTADLDKLVWYEEPVQDSQEYLSIHEIPRPAAPPPQPNQVEMSGTPPPQSNKEEIQETPPTQTEQVEMPPQYELME